MKTQRIGKSSKKKAKKVMKSGFGLSRGMRPFKKEDELRGQLEEDE